MVPGLKVSTVSQQVAKNWFFFRSSVFRGTYEHPIGRNQFQNIPRRVAEFHENRFRGVEKSVDGKKDKTSRLQHVSDLHLKFALMPQHVWKYGRHPICDGWVIRRGKKEERKKEV